MLRSLCLSILALFFAAFPAIGQSTGAGSSQPVSPPQDSSASAESKKAKRVWTNENVPKSTDAVSVVGGGKEKSKSAVSKRADAQYVASVRKQLEKLQKQVEDVDKQLADLKNFKEGKPSTTASGVKLDKRYEREPIEVQIRALQDQKKDLQSKMDALLNEARKKGVEPGELR